MSGSRGFSYLFGNFKTVGGFGRGLFFLVFLCIFFPLQMLVYSLARGIEARNTVLIFFSLVFYAWGEPFFIVLLVFMCFVDWALSQGIYKYRGTGKSKAS